MRMLQAVGLEAHIGERAASKTVDSRTPQEYPEGCLGWPTRSLSRALREIQEKPAPSPEPCGRRIRGSRNRRFAQWKPWQEDNDQAGHTR